MILQSSAAEVSQYDSLHPVVVGGAQDAMKTVLHPMVDLILDKLTYKEIYPSSKYRLKLTK